MSTETLNTTKWAIDPSHSEIQFKVKHLMITTVTGSFSEFGAEVDLAGDDLDGAEVTFWARTSSVSTGSDQRDEHLRSPDFFDHEKYPRISFKSTEVRKQGSSWKVIGELTIKDVTRPVTLEAKWNGIMTDPWGNKKAGVELSSSLDRRDFGLNWNAALEAGGVLVSDEVRLLCEVQLSEKS